MRIFKNIIRLPFRAIGYDIIRRNKPNYTWLKEIGIRTLLDIGANVGQYAMEMSRVLPDPYIYSFEPLECCFRKLNENMKHAQRFQAFHFALGDSSGEAKINRSEHTPASSILKAGDILHNHFSHAAVSVTETIRIERLDDIATLLDLKTPIMIKIDVQGFEEKVIAGGVETIQRSKILIVETSFEELYKGQPLFGTIYDILRELGFNYRGCDHQVRSDKDRRVLQENSIFIKSNT